MIKIGVIGLGDISQKAYMPVISSLKNVEWHLFTRNERKLTEISQKYRFQHLHVNLTSLIKAEIQAAFVHSSTESHYSIVKELLSAGIHVYVDKPITYNAETTKELVELAENKNLILMTGFNRRLAPLYQSLQEVSNPNMIIMQKNRRSLPGEVRTFIFDDFIHVVDTVRFLLPNEIQKMHVIGRKEGNLLYDVTVQFITEGAMGLAIMNRDSGTTEEKLEVMGPDEKRVVTNLSELTILQNNKETKQSFNDWDSTLYKRGFEKIIGEFIQAVQEGTKPTISVRDSLRTHELCEEIVKKLESVCS